MCGFSSGVKILSILQNGCELHSAFSAIYIYEKNYGGIGVKNFLEKFRSAKRPIFV